MSESDQEKLHELQKELAFLLSMQYEGEPPTKEELDLRDEIGDIWLKQNQKD